MHNKLEELTKKIYNEGIEKGKEEAENIISGAKQKADSILTEAQKRADSIVKDAEKKAGEVDANTKSELKMASKQILNTLKQNITDIITGGIVSEPVNESLQDKKFIKEIIEKIVANWNPNNNDTVDLNVLLPANQKNELDGYFKNEAAGLLKKGLEIQFENGLKSGFQISPKDGSYKLSFSDKEFENFFKEYLRPKLIELLFGE